MYNITSFGVINILVYGGWGSNFSTCPNMVNEVKKNAKHIFYIFELLNYKKQSKYRFRQLVHLCTRNYNIEYPPHPQPPLPHPPPRTI